MGVGFWRCRGGGGSGRGRRPRRHRYAAMRGRGEDWVVGAPLAGRNNKKRRRVIPSGGTAQNWASTTSLCARGGLRSVRPASKCSWRGLTDASRCVGTDSTKNRGDRSSFGHATARGVKGLRCPSRSPPPSPPLPVPLRGVVASSRSPIRSHPCPD